MSLMLSLMSYPGGGSRGHLGSCARALGDLAGCVRPQAVLPSARKRP